EWTLESGSRCLDRVVSRQLREVDKCRCRKPASPGLSRWGRHCRLPHCHAPRRHSCHQLRLLDFAYATTLKGDIVFASPRLSPLRTALAFHSLWVRRYYGRLIEGFSSIAAPLTKLFQKK
ncbi:hypothetical protein HAX54_031461, partial [Datura stramonium]|nr:hypothetical protein [Datura stramonium]